MGVEHNGPHQLDGIFRRVGSDFPVEASSFMIVDFASNRKSVGALLGQCHQFSLVTSAERFVIHYANFP